MSKLAIITGADGGMGTEITRAVAQAGYHVIMLCYALFKGECSTGRLSCNYVVLHSFQRRGA